MCRWVGLRAFRFEAFAESIVELETCGLAPAYPDTARLGILVSRALLEGQQHLMCLGSHKGLTGVNPTPYEELGYSSEQVRIGRGSCESSGTGCRGVCEAGEAEANQPGLPGRRAGDHSPAVLHCVVTVPVQGTVQSLGFRVYKAMDG